MTILKIIKIPMNLFANYYLEILKIITIPIKLIANPPFAYLKMLYPRIEVLWHCRCGPIKLPVNPPILYFDIFNFDCKSAFSISQNDLLANQSALAFPMGFN